MTVPPQKKIRKKKKAEKGVFLRKTGESGPVFQKS
jgi:hypothetical protein